MKTLNRGLVGFVGLILFAAAGGVWFLYQEQDVPASGAMEHLVWDGDARAEEELEETPSATLPQAPDDPEAPFRWPEGVVAGELVFSFDSQAELEAFLRNARRAGLSVDVIAELRTVRVRTRSEEDARLAMRLGGNGQLSFNPYTATPEVPPLEGISAAYQPFGDKALEWMGVPEDHAHWGEGVTIAVLDTGVNAHPMLDGASITHLSMLGDGVDKGTHGTAVASLLVGELGIVPAADLLSIQVMGGDGVGSAFDLAAGIIAAVEAGAEFINISSGTTMSDPALLAAIEYAQGRDIPIFASAGNDGGGRLLYPAGYDEVIPVGAVDHGKQQMPFSNRGERLVFGGPGYGIPAAGSEGELILTNGTSFSSPLVMGGAVGLSGEENLSPSEAVRILRETANDTGPTGADPYTGEGTPDLVRAMSYDESGIYDVATAGHFLTMEGDVPHVVVTVENRGTEAVGNIRLEVDVNGRTHEIFLGTLEANAQAAGSVPVGPFIQDQEQMTVVARVSAPGIEDSRSDNDMNGSTITFKARD